MQSEEPPLRYRTWNRRSDTGRGTAAQIQSEEMYTNWYRHEPTWTFFSVASGKRSLSYSPKIKLKRPNSTWCALWHSSVASGGDVANNEISSKTKSASIAIYFSVQFPPWDYMFYSSCLFIYISPWCRLLIQRLISYILFHRQNPGVSLVSEWKWFVKLNLRWFCAHHSHSSV